MAAASEVEARDARREIRTYSRTLPTTLRTRVQISADFNTVLSRVANDGAGEVRRRGWAPAACDAAGVGRRRPPRRPRGRYPRVVGIGPSRHSCAQHRRGAVNAAATARRVPLRRVSSESARRTLPRRPQFCCCGMYAAVAPDDSLLCRMDRSDAASAKEGASLAVHSADDADALIHMILRGQPCETDAIVRYGREPLTSTDVFNFTALIEGSASAAVWRSLLLRAAALFVEQAAAPRLIALVRAHCRPAQFPEGSALSVDKNP
jgi:hypothetical protein